MMPCAFGEIGKYALGFGDFAAQQSNARQRKPEHGDGRAAVRNSASPVKETVVGQPILTAGRSERVTRVKTNVKGLPVVGGQWSSPAESEIIKTRHRNSDAQHSQTKRRESRRGTATLCHTNNCASNRCRQGARNECWQMGVIGSYKCLHPSCHSSVTSINRINWLRRRNRTYVQLRRYC